MSLKKHMIKVHKMEPINVVKRPRKVRKDKGKPKLSTAGRLVGVFETICEKSTEETDNSVRECFKDIITTFHEEVCYNLWL